METEKAKDDFRYLTNLLNFVDGVEVMMDLQQKYFKSRDRDVLMQSKAQEKKVREFITKFKERKRQENGGEKEKAPQ